MFFVWKRNDGYIAATTYWPANFICGNGDATTFEHLGKFANWTDAYNCIAEASDAGQLPVAH